MVDGRPYQRVQSTTRAQIGDSPLSGGTQWGPSGDPVGTQKDRCVDAAGVEATFDDLTARGYVESDPLELKHLSSQEGWF